MGFPGRLRGFGRCCAALLAWLLGLVALPAIGPELPTPDGEVIVILPAGLDELPAQRRAELAAHPSQAPPAVLEAAASSFSQPVAVIVATYVYDGTRVPIQGYVGTSDPVNRWDPSGLFWIYRNGAWEWIDDESRIPEFIGADGGFILALRRGGSLEGGVNADEVAVPGGFAQRDLLSQIGPESSVTGGRFGPSHVLLPADLQFNLPEAQRAFSQLDVRINSEIQDVVAQQAAAAVILPNAPSGARAEAGFRFVTGQSLEEGFTEIGRGFTQRVAVNGRELILTGFDIGQGASVRIIDAATGEEVDVEFQSQVGQALASGEVTPTDVAIGSLRAPFDIGEDFSLTAIDVNEGRASLEDLGESGADLGTVLVQQAKLRAQRRSNAQRNRAQGLAGEARFIERLKSSDRFEFVEQQVRVRTPDAGSFRVTDVLARDVIRDQLVIFEVKTGAATRSAAQALKDGLIVDPLAPTTFFGRNAARLGLAGESTGSIRTIVINADSIR